MATKSFVRTRAGQRVDQPDFEHVADQTPRDVQEQIGQHFITGSDTANPYVLEGFATTLAGTVITVSGGVALMNYRDRGVLRRGSIMSDGPLSRSIDIAAYSGSPTTTYNVYVCLTLNDSDFGNRPYWDNVGGAEETRNVPTRRSESWAIAVETVSPGDEWLLVASVSKNGASVGSLTDLRPFYFEGAPNTTYQVTTSEWGTTDDRNNTRATYGIKSLRKFVRAVQSQIQSIIGTASPGGWWSAVPAGANLTTLLSSKLARDGSQTMQGNLLPDGNSTRDLGATVTRWANIYGANVFGDLFRTSATGRYRSVGNNNVLSGGGRTPMLDGIMEGTSPNLEYRIVYQNDAANLPSTSGPTIEIAINAEWYYDVGALALRWRSLNTGVASYLYSFSRNDGFQVYRRAPTASVWTDIGWTLLHEMSHTKFESAVAANFTSAVTLGSTVTVNGATMTLNGTALSVTGASTLAALTAHRATLTTAAPSTPATRTIYSDTLVIARGRIVCTTAGGGSVSVDRHVNVDLTGVTRTGSGLSHRIYVPFKTASTANYQVLLTTNDTTRSSCLWSADPRDSGSFNIQIYNSAGVIDPHSVNLEIDFVVIGG